MSEDFIVNSNQSLAFAVNILKANFKEKKFTTYSARHGEKRSLSQNALFHVWCTEYAAFALKIHKSAVTEGQLEGAKRHFKRAAYNENGWQFLIIKLYNIESGEERKDFRSSTKYTHPEMFQFLTWVQAYAIDRGCLLESKGKFKHDQEKQNG